MLGAEGEDNRVVVRRRLQLEVERHAEPLAQRQPERPVDAPAEGRVDDQLRALGVVEAPLDHDALTGRQVAERLESGRAVGDDLLGHLGRHPGALAHEPARCVAVGVAQERLESAAQVAHGLGELGRAGRCLAQPERDRRREVTGVVHAHGADLHLGDAPRVRPEQEDVSGRGLHREVLVHRADRHPIGIEDDAVVAGLGDGAAAGQCRQARTRRARNRPLTAS